METSIGIHRKMLTNSSEDFIIETSRLQIISPDFNYFVTKR